MPRRSNVIQPEGYDEILRDIQEKIKIQASRPNLYAYVPHDKQFMFHSSSAKVILYIGGNRSGKTVGGAVESIYRLIGRHPFKKVPDGPIRGRACAVDFNYGVDMIMLPEIARWMPPSQLINGSWSDSYDKEHKVLTLRNKSFLEFRSYDQDLEKFAGTSRHFCWYDEEPPKHIYDESQARLVDTDGDAYLTMTPVEGMSWVYESIYQPGLSGTRKDVFVVEIDMSENPHVGAEARERYLSTLDPEMRKARESGQFVALGGKIFKEFAKTLHVVPFEIPPKSWEWFSTIDHGYNNPTAILWHAVSPKNEILTFSEHYAREMVVAEHAKIWHARNTGFGKVPDITVGDPAMAQRSGITGTSILQEYADNGVYIGGERTDVDSGLNRMIAYLKIDPEIGRPRWRITENCGNLIGEMQKYRWATFASRKAQYDKNAQDKPHKKDDHAIDSTRYMFTLMPDLRPQVYGKPVNEEGEFKLGSTSNVSVAGTWDEVLALERKTGQVSTSWKTSVGSDIGALEY